jgi:chromosome partitioning protein
MKTVAFFNNKGGVGKTTLAYHLAWMFAELGHRVVAADLDPQANFSSICLSEERLEEIWQANPRPTIFSALSDLRRGIGELRHQPLESVRDRLWLMVGDLALSDFEDDLSATWTKTLEGDERAFRITTAFHRLLKTAGEAKNANIGLIDVGPNLGAINRAALIAADYVIVPTAPDLFSVQGLENVGPRLIDWRNGWVERKAKAKPEFDFSLPSGGLQPIGYVVSRHAEHASRPIKAFRKWLDRLPEMYRRKVANDPEPSILAIENDENCLAQIKDYRSLMPMAQEARLPMFALKPADGAIGGHQNAVRDCYVQNVILARKILEKIGMPPPDLR